MDFLTDSSRRQFHRIFKLYDVPTFVKQADQSLLSANPSLNYRCYALPSRRLFPCHTKAATWLSWAYFLENKNSFGDSAAREIEETLSKRAAYWDIEEEVERLKSEHQAIFSDKEEELDDNAFLLADKQASFRRYPVRNFSEAAAASRWLLQHAFSMPWEQRTKLAARWRQRCAALALDEKKLPHVDEIRKMASHGFALRNDVIHELEARADRLESAPDLRIELRKAAALLRSCNFPVLPRNVSAKLAALVDCIDRSAGLDNLYHKTADPPEYFLFEHDPARFKSAAENVVRIGCGEYLPEDVFRIPREKLAAAMGSEFVADISNGLADDPTKVADAVRRQPPSAVGRLDQLLRQSGVSPLQSSLPAPRRGRYGAFSDLVEV